MIIQILTIWVSRHGKYEDVGWLVDQVRLLVMRAVRDPLCCEHMSEHPLLKVRLSVVGPGLSCGDAGVRKERTWVDISGQEESFTA